MKPLRFSLLLLAALAVFLAPSVEVMAEGGNNADYRLGGGDVIRISVFQNADLTLEARVSENGAVTYPLLGSVELGGLSAGAAERKLAKLLKEGGFVVDPQVTIALMQVRGNQVSVLGQVNRPGRYPLEVGNMKLSDILALAGGVIPGGSDTVALSGWRDGKLMHREVDVPAMLLNGRMDDDIEVRNGDIVYVHRAPMFYVYGEVQRPGSYRVERDMTVMQALAQGGGITLRGTQRGVRIYRRDESGKVREIEPDMQAGVRADDVVYVRESLF
jgi:polysaccharide export outer membrane protein